MSAVKKKKPKTKVLASRDPLKDLKKRRKPYQLTLCTLSTSLVVGKTIKKKKADELIMTVQRAECSRYYSYPYGSNDEKYVSYTFYVKFKDKKKAGAYADHIADFEVRFENGIACISSSSLDDEYHGMGIGKQIYSTIAGYLGVLESDPNGATSQQARYVWKAMKARRLKNNRYRVVSNKRIKFK